MKKFLSILMLVCLLLGMVLPVAAEGEGGGSTTAKLYAKTGSGEEYLESLTFATGETLTARFYTSNAAESVAITSGTFTSDKTDLTIGAPDENGNCALNADVAGDYTVSYELGGTTYSMTVTVTVPTTNTITVPDAATLNAILSDQAAFETFLTTNHYSGSGDLTLMLPSGDLGSVTCNVQLPGDTILTLKGAAGGTSMTGLIVNGDNISIDGIRFTGSDTAITLNSLPESVCEITNCQFDKTLKYAFDVKQTTNDIAPTISLLGNNFPTIETNSSGNKQPNVKALVRDSDGNEVGRWQMGSGSKTVATDVNFSASVFRDQSKAIWVGLLGDNGDAAKNGWIFNFNTPCTFTTSYVAHDGKRVEGLAPSSGRITLPATSYFDYVIVNGTYPTAVNGKVEISEDHATYLREVTVDTTYANATVTVGTKKVPAAVNNKKLTFSLNGKGTYTIAEIKTTTTTKTTTTSRSYNYKYQDYYLITPQRVTDCTRYVKDNLVTIECKEAGRRSISLPVASMAQVAEKGYSILLKNEKIADITLDAAALKSLAQQAKGTTVLLHYKSLNHKTLTTVGQASIQSHLSQFPGDSADLAFLLTATSDSETIEDLQKGTITLKIPFIVLPGTEEMENRVYALQSESLSEARETAVADGCLTTTLLDLTEHMVFQVGEPVETTGETTEATVETTVETTEETTQPETEPETTAPAEPVETAKKGGGLIIGLSVVLVILCGVVGFVFLRKRFRK